MGYASPEILPAPPRVEGDDGEAVEQRGLEETDPQRPSCDDEHDEQAGGARRREERDEGERLPVVERDLADDPAVAPDGRDHRKREDAQVASVVSVGVGHAPMLADVLSGAQQDGVCVLLSSLVIREIDLTSAVALSWLVAIG
jgi:hypothetical protein